MDCGKDCMSKYLIINADDFGYTRGVNQGILETHLYGVVSSTSLMVDAPWATEATIAARQYPSLGVGLHFVATHDEKPLFNLDDISVVERELHHQHQRFCELLGRLPTHLDSHEHIHLKKKELKPLFCTWAEEYHLPLRGLGIIHFNGGFYGHRFDEEWRLQTAPELISIENLEKILRALPNGVTELACHPAHMTPDLDSSYAVERGIELATLLNPRVRELLCELDISVINFAAWLQFG